MPEFQHRDVRLFYREERPPRRASRPPARSRPVVVLLPGSTASSASMAGELRYFGHRYHTVALDPPGTGRSQRLSAWPEDWWGLTADATADLIAQRRLDPVVAVGSGGGGTAALLLAIRHPDAVAAVCADSCAATIPADDLLHQAAARRAVVRRLRASTTRRQPSRRPPGRIDDPAADSGTGLRSMVHGWSLGWFWRRAHGRDWPSVIMAECDLLERVAQAGGFAPFGDRLSSISCPVLLSGSEEDEMIPDLGPRLEAMAQRIPQCRVFLWPEGGHPLMWTAPSAFRRAVDDLLDGLAAAATEQGRRLG